MKKKLPVFFEVTVCDVTWEAVIDRIFYKTGTNLFIINDCLK
jgi:hypothetical protein